jgi:hypothetical protein
VVLELLLFRHGSILGVAWKPESLSLDTWALVLEFSFGESEKVHFCKVIPAAKENVGGARSSHHFPLVTKAVGIVRQMHTEKKDLRGTTMTEPVKVSTPSFPTSRHCHDDGVLNEGHISCRVVRSHPVAANRIH